MNIEISKEYDEINNIIKNDITNHFELFNNNSDENIIPMSKIEINNEIKREMSPILFSLNNKIKYSTIKNINEINYFRLVKQNIKEIKYKILDINEKIDKINNKIDIIKDKNLLKSISLKKSNIELTNKISNIKSREDILIKYYEKIKKKLLNTKKTKEDILLKLSTNDNMKDNNINILNNLKKNLTVLIEKMKFEMEKKSDKLNEMKSMLNFINEINIIKNSIKNIDDKMKEIKNNKLDIHAIYSLKNLINIIKTKINNEIFIKIKLFSKENNNIYRKTIENNLRILEFQNNVKNNLQKSKNIEIEINNIRTSSLSNEKLETINNIGKEDIYNLKQNQSLIKFKLEKIFENIISVKNPLDDYVKKIDFYKYIETFGNSLNQINNDFSEKISYVEKYKNYYSKLILSNIDSRKEKINKIENEKNLINSKFLEISDLAKKCNDNNNIFKQQIENMEKDLMNYNKIFENFIIINNQVNNHKKDINDFTNKLNELQNYKKNIIMNNINFQNDFRKSMNNFLYENKKQINEMNRQNLFNKKSAKNLIVYLENFEKNIINNKVFITNKIDRLIKSQNEINKRTKDYFNYNKKIVDKNKIDKIKKLKTFKNTINKIISRFIYINDNNKDNNLKIKNLQDLLNKNKLEINEEFENIKIYLNQKLLEIKKK